MNIRQKFMVIGVLSIAACVAILFEDQLLGTKANVGEITYSIENVTCQECPRPLDVVIENLVGIEGYTVDQHTKSVRVQYNPIQTESEWIEKAIEAHGYQIAKK